MKRVRRKKVAVGFTEMEKAVAQIVAENLGFSDFGRFVRYCIWGIQTLEQTAETRKGLIKSAWEFRVAEEREGSVLDHPANGGER